MQQQQSKLIKLLVEQTWTTWTYFVCHSWYTADIRTNNMFQNALKACLWRSSSSHNIYPVLFVYFRKLYFLYFRGKFFISNLLFQYCANYSCYEPTNDCRVIWERKNCVEIKCRKKIKLINASVTIAFFDVDINARTAL